MERATKIFRQPSVAMAQRIKIPGMKGSTGMDEDEEESVVNLLSNIVDVFDETKTDIEYENFDARFGDLA